jgi:hypothetical protein
MLPYFNPNGYSIEKSEMRVCAKTKEIERAKEKKNEGKKFRTITDAI